MSVHDSLFVGIDVSKNTNVVYMTNFDQDKLSKLNAANNEVGASIIEKEILSVVEKHSLSKVIIVLESTSVYSYHIATYLAASSSLLPYGVLVYTINPKIARNYRKSFSDIDKTDPIDSFILADLARVGRVNKMTPVKGTQKVALQRLTRHRQHIATQLGREKTYILSNIFLKFSEFGKNNQEGRNLSSNFGKTAISILEEFKTIDDLINTSIEDLAEFISEKSLNKISNSTQMAKVIKQSANNSYRLDKMAYEPINFAIMSSLNIINCLQSEIKTIDKAIIKQVRGFDDNSFNILLSVPGIGPVFAAGILAEIGSIDQFPKEEQLAKYAGITWRTNQSGDFSADETPMTKTGNKYLRYYITEAANLTRLNNQTYHNYYNKKYAESKTHHHKRALALTSRKLVRLIHGLLSKNQLYKEQ